MPTKRLYKTSLELDRDLVERFRSFYPQNGALRWFVTSCLEKFNELHDDNVDEEIKETVRQALVKHYEGD